VSALRDANELRNGVFVSTNYDILINNALTEERVHGTDLDYAIEFRDFERPDDWERPVRSNRVQLFKPHGSLNWPFCSTCNELEITPKEKEVVTRLISDFTGERCLDCRAGQAAVIIGALDQAPPFAGLALDKRLTRLALCVQVVELLLQTFFRRLRV
jgi:hypothetical protein